MKRKEKVLTAENLGNRLDTILMDMKRWKVSVDKTAKLSTFSRALVRSTSGFDQATDQLDKAMSELDRGNLYGAAYHLDQAEIHYSMRNVNEVNMPRFVQAATKGERFALSNKRGGDKTAEILKRKSAERENNLETEAKKIRKLKPNWSTAEIARSLSERMDLGGKQSIYRKLLRLLRE